MRYAHGIRVEKFAEILKREINRRGLQSTALELEAAGFMTADAACRAFHRILNPEYTNNRTGKRHTQHLVSIGMVDQILTALDLNHLWRCELEEAEVETHSARKRGVCAGCGVDWDVYTNGCPRCVTRRHNRRVRAKRGVASEQPANGLSAGQTAGDATTLEEAA